MKVLITGVAGFIGSNLAHYLLSENHTVAGVDNFITGSRDNLKELLKNSSFTFQELDITENKLQKETFDIIFHLASPASPVQYMKHAIPTLLTNSLGTRNILEFMRETKSKSLVFSSTSEVYGDPQVHPQVEEYWGNVNPVGLRSCYDEAKRFAESLCMAYVRTHDLDIRIARIFNTYGPNMERDDGRVISNFITQALAKKPLTVYGDGKQTRSFCFVTDMVAALTLLGQKKDLKGKIINLGNPDERTILDISHLVLKLTKGTSEVSFQKKGADDPARRKPDITKAKRLLDWEPQVKLEDGLQKTISYFQKRFFN